MGQNKRYKNALFFLTRAPTYHSFTYSQFLYKLRRKVHLSKTVCGHASKMYLEKLRKNGVFSVLMSQSNPLSYLKRNKLVFKQRNVKYIFTDTLKALGEFKNQQKSVWSKVYVKLCIFWKCIQYTMHWDKTQILKKIFFGQNKRYKKCLLFYFASPNSSQFYF